MASLITSSICEMIISEVGIVGRAAVLVEVISLDVYESIAVTLREPKAHPTSTAKQVDEL